MTRATDGSPAYTADVDEQSTHHAWMARLDGVPVSLFQEYPLRGGGGGALRPDAPRPRAALHGWRPQ
jgi:hypothetical protein